MNKDTAILSLAVLMLVVGSSGLIYGAIQIIRSSQVTVIIPGGGDDGDLPIYRFTVPTTIAFETLDTSLTKTVNVTITNPTQTTYSVTITSTPPAGFTISLVDSPISISPGDNIVKLTITASADTQPGTYTFTVNFIGAA